VLFTGHSLNSIDAKARLSIPAKYRSQWSDERDGKAWYCVPWPGGILRLYTETAFTAMAESIEQSLMPAEDQADLDADLFSLAERLEMDAQGRVALPAPHLELTGLSGEVVVIGARNRLEVRDRAQWLQSQTDRFQRLPTLVARTRTRSHDA
jgi:MraZ protein